MTEASHGAGAGARRACFQRFGAETESQWRSTLERTKFTGVGRVALALLGIGSERGCLAGSGFARPRLSPTAPHSK